MKRFTLQILMVTATLLNVACGDDKTREPSMQEKVHACMWDSTGECQKKAAAYAASPAILPIANQVLAQNPGILNGIAGTKPVVAPPLANVGTGTGIATTKPASVDDKAIKAMAAKVDAAIQADNNNPNSLRYDPPQANRAPASASGGVQPASSSAASANTANAPMDNGSSYGGGIR